MTLHTNIFNLIGRTIILFISAILILLFIHFGLPDSNIKQKPILYFILILMIFLFIGMFITLFGVIKVEINKSVGEISFGRLFSKNSIMKKDILGYFTTFSYVNRSHSKIFYGIVIKLYNNKTIELNEYNLKSVSELKKYLQDSEIKLLGNKQSYFPFKIRT